MAIKSKYSKAKIEKIDNLRKQGGNLWMF
jgi:hypothetical protein